MSLNHLNLNHNDYIAVEPTLFNGWFLFKRRAEQSGLFNPNDVSRINGVNGRLMNLLIARDESKPVRIDRDMALMIWDVYHAAKNWPIVMHSFANDPDTISNIESIIETIKSFCIDKSIHEVIR